MLAFYVAKTIKNLISFDTYIKCGLLVIYLYSIASKVKGGLFAVLHIGQYDYFLRPQFQFVIT
jgi:hypothetical protein